MHFKNELNNCRGLEDAESIPTGGAHGRFGARFPSKVGKLFYLMKQLKEVFFYARLPQNWKLVIFMSMQ